MGLTSLPILNRVGHIDYWQNLWWGDKKYKKLLISILMLNDFNKHISNERVCHISYLKDYKIFIYLSKQKTLMISKLIRRNVYLGEIWLFKYQSWVIISPSIYKKNTTFNVTRKKSNKLAFITFLILNKYIFKHFDYDFN